METRTDTDMTVTEIAARVEGIRNRSALFSKGHRAQIVVRPYGMTESVRGIEDAYHQAPSDVAFLLSELACQTARADGLDAALNVMTQKHREARDETAAVWGKALDAEAATGSGRGPSLQPPTDPDGGPLPKPAVPVMPSSASVATVAEPSPLPSEGDVWASVIASLPEGEIKTLCTERRAFGFQKYGTVLQPHNGRNWRNDAIQEALAGVVYSAQGELEGDLDARGARLAFLDVLKVLLRKRRFYAGAERLQLGSFSTPPVLFGDVEANLRQFTPGGGGMGAGAFLGLPSPAPGSGGASAVVPVAASVVSEADLITVAYMTFTRDICGAVGMPKEEAQALKGGLHKELVVRVRKLFAKAATDAADWEEEEDCPHADTTAETVDAVAGPTVVTMCRDCGATRLAGEKEWKP